MNISRILNFGKQFFNKLPGTLPAVTDIRLENLSLLQSSLFSSFSKSNGISKCSELTLTPFGPLFVNLRGMKVRGELQLRCKDCYFIRKDGVMYVMCSSYPRHNQRQFTKPKKSGWILTYALQTRYRPY